MPLGKPDAEDRRKIHVEITQFGTQRLQITGFAITLFGAIEAWLIPKTTPHCLDPLTYITSIVLACLLFALYFFGHLIRNLLRIYSSYLIVTNASDWECDWKRYRDQGYLGYTKAQTWLFLFLGILSTSLPPGLVKIYNLVPNPPCIGRTSQSASPTSSWLPDWGLDWATQRLAPHLAGRSLRVKFRNHESRSSALGNISKNYDRA